MVDAMKNWEYDGIRIVRAGELDTNTPQTPGMTRAAAITHARTGANKLWAGTVVVQPDAKTGPHHHGGLETVLYVVRGRARMRWGDRLEFSDEAGPGDFIYVPPYVPQQAINARRDEPCEAVVVAPAARTAAHHHGELETVLYIVKGRARMRWGEHLEFSGEAGPGDFIYVPPYVPHQEMNARADEPVEAVVVRSGQDPIVVNLEMESPEPASAGTGDVPFHPEP